MVDGLKILRLVTHQPLNENPILSGSWQSIVMQTTGEIIGGYASVKGLQFQEKNYCSRLKGSLHKYNNHGNHNYDDFKGEDVSRVVTELESDFCIDSSQTVINGIEFGMNIQVPFTVQPFLGNLVSFKGTPFNSKFENDFHYYEAVTQRYTLKIYDKGLQFRLNENIIRVEISVNKMVFFDSCEIRLKYLSDLHDQQLYPKLKKVLADIFQEIIFTDFSINESDLTNRERDLFLRASNPKTWIVISKEKSVYEHRRRLRKSFEELKNKHRRGLDFSKIIIEAIIDNC
jgi:hypothetical protein